MESAQAFFRTAVRQEGVSWPSKINVDGNSATHRGLRLLAAEDRRWQSVEVRSRRYLNNVVEQDHRAIKQRCASMLGLKSFRSAAITLAGIELAHRLRKQQYSLHSGLTGRVRSLKESWDVALAEGAPPIFRNGDRTSPMQQNSADCSRPARETPRRDGSVRYPQKISFGGNLYLLVRPQGGRYWQYHYRYAGKRKTVSLGTYPDVPILRARSRPGGSAPARGRGGSLTLAKVAAARMAAIGLPRRQLACPSLKSNSPTGSEPIRPPGWPAGCQGTFP
jgi:hypothetical protein